MNLIKIIVSNFSLSVIRELNHLKTSKNLGKSLLAQQTIKSLEELLRKPRISLGTVGHDRHVVRKYKLDFYDNDGIILASGLFYLLFYLLFFTIFTI